MVSRFLRAGRLALFLLPFLLLAAKAAAQRDNVAMEQEKQEDTKNRSKSAKTHFAKGNQAMQEAKAIRQQLQATTNDQKPALLAKMKANYQTAITEYQQALQDTEVKDENGVRVIGLIGVIRNGLVSQEKAVDMLVQDKDLPVIVSNLGMAYSGAGEYQEAITMLQQAAIMQPAATTYMELGTDFAELGRTQEATATCDKILAVDATATSLQAGCYKNIAIVLTNAGKMADAVAPLQKATQLNPQDAPSWKLLGDALSSTMATKSEHGKTIYVIPPGTIEAYQKYLQLQPNGPYAEQVKSTLEALARISKPASNPTDKKN
jgi:tetratricopeptide (TPR) repeat protein